ncbi:hypothetical protein F4780DRAFT_783287 [Xylariomycetidae sp. FL0641]|nr:hypothetical protein F4780DRAFT_783287 [Xylariomycetidae sp. FL0641]
MADLYVIGAHPNFPTSRCWFQAVKGANAVQSGIDTILTVLGLVVGAIVSGGITTKTGYYVTWVFLSATFMSVRAGLTTTLTVDTGSPVRIGPDSVSDADVSIGIGILFFSQSLGGAVFTCIGQSLFGNLLAQTLPSIFAPDIRAAFAAGAAEFNKILAADQLVAVLEVYNDSLQKPFIGAVAAAATMVLRALGVE